MLTCVPIIVFRVDGMKILFSPGALINISVLIWIWILKSRVQNLVDNNHSSLAKYHHSELSKVGIVAVCSAPPSQNLTYWLMWTIFF